MGIAGGIVTYVIIWWLVVFMVLPWGDNRPPEEPEPGHAPSAPERPRLLAKMLITTAIATILWIVVFLVAESGLISFREWSRSLG